jgi:hypothetical protein
VLVRRALEDRLSGGSFVAALGLLLAILSTGGVTYLLIAGRPPRVTSDVLDDTS